MVVKERDRIAVQYVGTLDDGTEFDSSEGHGGKPLEFVVGAHMVIPGFENAVMGMDVGSEKQVRIPAADAYGEPDEELYRKVPRDKIGLKDLEPGMMLGIQLANGQQIPAKVKDVNDKEVTLDMNHPLAGQALNFKLKLEAILEENVDLAALEAESCGCGCDSCGDDNCGGCGEDENDHDHGDDCGCGHHH
jgi:peptidylprolyl isomerase